LAIAAFLLPAACVLDEAGPREANMRKATVGIMSLLMLVLTMTLFALNEHKLGKHSQQEIKDACNAVGGKLLGVSDSGSYGCENDNAGTLVLCNNNNECTGWTSARTSADRKHILATIKLKVLPETTKPK
jgi:hypothetical protein